MDASITTFQHRHIVYRPGNDNPADYLSRHPVAIAEPTSREEKIAEEYFSYIATASTPKTMKLEETKHATAKDATLTATIEAVRTNNWQNASRQGHVNRPNLVRYKRCVTNCQSPKICCCVTKR